MNYGSKKYYVTGPFGLYYKFYEDRKWSLYYKCVLALALDLAIVINYECKWSS